MYINYLPLMLLFDVITCLTKVQHSILKYLKGHLKSTGSHQTNPVMYCPCWAETHPHNMGRNEVSFKNVDILYISYIEGLMEKWV